MDLIMNLIMDLHLRFQFSMNNPDGAASHGMHRVAALIIGTAGLAGEGGSGKI
jgi:hypothetical protein